MTNREVDHLRELISGNPCEILDRGSLSERMGALVRSSTHTHAFKYIRTLAF